MSLSKDVRAKTKFLTVVLKSDLAPVGLDLGGEETNTMIKWW